MRNLLRRIARRCDTHDRPSYPRIRDLEQSLGITPSAQPSSFADAYSDPALIDCGNAWCNSRRR
ncbi:hypothetical protein [Streptomyces sp. NPDC058254]|uniref:hypothetical protein n=1 Tax=Streptomyces sp. NPDC058254 TaxID=3346406 RepID=UPI0036E67FDE